MGVGQVGGFAPLAAALEEADLQEERLHEVLDVVGVLVEGGGDGLDADGAALVEVNDDAEVLAVVLVEAVREIMNPWSPNPCPAGTSLRSLSR